MIKIIFTIAIIISFSIAILMLLVIIGADKCKTNQEKLDELEEQARIVSSPEYNERSSMEIPKQVTKNQLINYAIVAFCDLLNSANKDNFNVDEIETFILGAMEAHSKSNIKNIANIFKEKYKNKKIIITVEDK